MKPDELYKELGILVDGLDRLTVGRPIDGMDPGTDKRIRNGLRVAANYLRTARRHVDGPLPPVPPKPAPRKPTPPLPSQAVVDHTTDELSGKQKQGQQKTD